MSALKLIWGFLGSNWQLIVIALVAAYAASLKLSLSAEQVRSAKLTTDLSVCNSTLANERQAVRDRTAQAKAEDAAHAARVEARDAKEAMEEDSEIRNRLVRERAAARLHQTRSAPASASSGGAAPVPGSSAATPGADGGSGTPELDARDILICTDNTVKAQSWQQHQRRIEESPR